MLAFGLLSDLSRSEFPPTYTKTRCAQTPASTFILEQTISKPSASPGRVLTIWGSLTLTPSNGIVVEPVSYL